MQAHAILFTAVGNVEQAETTIPEPGPGEVVVEAAYSCISPGTELRCLGGQQPDALPWPYIPGYALSGWIAQTGPDTSIAVGTPVFCRGTKAAEHARQWGGHISHALVNESALYVLPPGVQPQDAALASMAAIALHGVRQSRPQIDERVAVVGLGPVGQLSARLHALAGARVIAADRVASRVEIARGAGIQALVVETDLATTFQPVFPEGADVVVDATGASAVLRQALDLAKAVPWGDTLATGARYLIQGSYPADFAIPYQEAFRKELTFLLPRALQPKDIRRALELIGNGGLYVRDLASIVAQPAEAQQVYTALREGTNGMMTALFKWH